ncbi:EamA family transporter RarD [Bacillaceae bacterium]
MNYPMPHEQTKGIWYGVAAYAVWGILPLYWKMLELVSPMEILAHRILWSFIFILLILSFSRRKGQSMAALSSRANRVSLLASALLISCNWLIYIWAVNHDRVLETSLGYYINPLVSIALGMLVYKEKLNAWQWVSLLFAAFGVVILAFQYGKIPWVALALAFSFGFYGLAKKMTKVDSVTGLALETGAVTPAALLYLVVAKAKGTASFGTDVFLSLLLIGTGVATVVPLLWFAQAAKKAPLSTIGFFQYIAPSITLILGVFLFKEPFTEIHMLSFGLIWCALLLYSVSLAGFGRQKRAPVYAREAKEGVSVNKGAK